MAYGVFSARRYLGSTVGSSVLAGLLRPTHDGVAGFGAVFLMAFVAALLSVLVRFGLKDEGSRLLSPSGDTNARSG